MRMFGCSYFWSSLVDQLSRYLVFGRLSGKQGRCHAFGCDLHLVVIICIDDYDSCVDNDAG